MCAQHGRELMGWKGGFKLEPPTAYPHGGRCGGWELDTPGDPIRRQFLLAHSMNLAEALHYLERADLRYATRLLR